MPKLTKIKKNLRKVRKALNKERNVSKDLEDQLDARQAELEEKELRLADREESLSKAASALADASTSATQATEEKQALSVKFEGLTSFVEDIGIAVPPDIKIPPGEVDPPDGCIDFEDLLAGTVYTEDPAMDSFTSEGVKFEVVEESSPFVRLPAVPGDGFIRVRPNPGPGVQNVTHHYGQFLNVNNKVLKLNVEQIVPGGASSGCFNYADLGGHVYLRVNGSSYKFDTDTASTPLGESSPGTRAPDMSWYHGLVIGGVSIHVTRYPMPGGHCGMVFLNGPKILTVEVGGQEFFVDRYCIPCVHWPPGGGENPGGSSTEAANPVSSTDGTVAGTATSSFTDPSGHILWNFDGTPASDVVPQGSLVGSILAPSSTVVAGSGVIEGQSVATSQSGGAFPTGDTAGVDGGSSVAYNHVVDNTGITLQSTPDGELLKTVCLDFEDLYSGMQYRAEEECCLTVPPEVRIRPEVTSMSSEDRRDFFIAFRAVYENNDGVLRNLIDDHQRFFSRGLHNNGAFLPWHRGYILAMENRIRKDFPTMTVPYWDWGEHTQVNSTSFLGDSEDQCSGDGDDNRCVQTGLFGFEEGWRLTNGNCMLRRISGGQAASTEYMQNQLHARYPDASQYDAFRNRLEHGPGMHDSIHCIVGGTMCSARSANDPLFWLHHAQVDKIWNDWQKNSDAHRDAYEGLTPRDTLMPASTWTPGQLLDLERQPGNVFVYYSSGSDDQPTLPIMPAGDTGAFEGHEQHNADPDDPSAAEHALLMSKPSGFNSGGGSFKLYNSTALSIPEPQADDRQSDVWGLHVRPAPGPGVSNPTGSYGQYLLLNDTLLEFDVADSFRINGEALYPAGVSSVCFKFSQGDNAVLGVNGEKSRKVSDLSDLNGLALGGARVSVVSGGYGRGIVRIRGDHSLIKKLTVGGRKLSLDVLKLEGCIPTDTELAGPADPLAGSAPASGPAGRVEYS